MKLDALAPVQKFASQSAIVNLENHHHGIKENPDNNGSLDKNGS
jgi:hypothetical protein